MSKVLKSCFFFILFLLSINLNGQIVQKLTLNKKEQKILADKLIHQQKGGILLVRLNFHEKQIDYFNSVIEDQNQSEKDKSWATKSRNEIIERRDTFNTFIRNAFDSVYTFSKVRYIFDKDYSAKDPGKNNGHFLNDQWQKDPSLNIGNQDFLVLSYTNLNMSSGQSKENFRVTTPDFTDVPGSIQIPGSGVLFNIKSDIRNIPQFRKAMIKKILSYQEKLDEYISKTSIED